MAGNATVNAANRRYVMHSSIRLTCCENTFQLTRDTCLMWIKIQDGRKQFVKSANCGTYSREAPLHKRGGNCTLTALPRHAPGKVQIPTSGEMLLLLPVGRLGLLIAAWCARVIDTLQTRQQDPNPTRR